MRMRHAPPIFLAIVQSAHGHLGRRLSLIGKYFCDFANLNFARRKRVSND
jgi:hypothetical protein